MAQQARPNVTGHIDCLRAQLTARSSVVRSTPRLTSCSTSELARPSCSPGRRSTGTKDPLLPPFIPEPPRRFVPVQAAPTPDVDVGHEDEADEHDHLHEPEQTESAEPHRPWEQEDRLDVEDDEQHGQHVELHGEALALREALR